MDYQELLSVAGDFAIAILLGALVGIEREKRKAEELETEHIAGLRTFTLLALLGAAVGLSRPRPVLCPGSWRRLSSSSAPSWRSAIARRRV